MTKKKKFYPRGQAIYDKKLKMKLYVVNVFSTDENVAIIKSLLSELKLSGLYESDLEGEETGLLYREDHYRVGLMTKRRTKAMVNLFHNILLTNRNSADKEAMFICKNKDLALKVKLMLGI